MDPKEFVSLQTQMRDELMQTWTNGLQAGLTVAHKMVGAVHADLLARLAKSQSDEERDAYRSQLGVVEAIQTSLREAASEAGGHSNAEF